MPEAVKQMQVKHTPTGSWHPWMHLCPTIPTLGILQREANANFDMAMKAKAEGRKVNTMPYALFYGEKIVEFKFLNGKVWHCLAGFEGGKQ